MIEAEGPSIKDAKEDVCTEVGYELITYDDDEDESGKKQKRLLVGANSQLSICPESNVAILDKDIRASNSRRRSSTFRGGVELINFVDQATEKDECPTTLQIGGKEPLLIDQDMRLAIFQTLTNEEEHSRVQCLKRTSTWPIVQSEPPISSSVANLTSIDEEREAGEVEIVLRIPERDDVPLPDDTKDDEDMRYYQLDSNVDDSSILYHVLPTIEDVNFSEEDDGGSLTCWTRKNSEVETTEFQRTYADSTLNDATQTCTS
jgi:hypothetical protein